MKFPSRKTPSLRSHTPKTLADIGERAFLARVRRWMAADSKNIPLAIGDDAAILPRQTGETIVSTDALIEGVHFRREWTSTHDLGHKSLAVNLSDLAAMGARPVAAFLALGVPPSTPLADLSSFFSGIRAEGKRWDCPLAGGDLVRAPQWTIAITVIGAPLIGKSKLFLRTGARPSDWIYVTGRPGKSGAGLAALQNKIKSSSLIRAHSRPVPRLSEASLLASLGCVSAALDLSDGIWDDASKLAEASGVALEIRRDALPLDPAFKRLASQLDCDPFDWTLFGGEDYELLFTTRRPIDLDRDWNSKKNKLAPLTLIGRVAAGRGVKLLDSHSRPIPVKEQTWKHF